MKPYLLLRQKREKVSVVTGVILTLAVHVGALVAVSFTGIKYLYPPPEENSFLVDFSEESEKIPMTYGKEPRAEEIDLSKPVELVQKSESDNITAKENLTPETKQDDFGDVETPAPEPKEEPKLDPRASFPGMAKKDTTLTAAHSASESSDERKAGQPDGNTVKGSSDGRPVTHLKGRPAIGTLSQPLYDVQERGTVVVSIWVDQYGNVTKAVPGAEGTTVTDKSLWAAARKAAMETHFTKDSNAPALQEGTITYIFNLK